MKATLPTLVVLACFSASGGGAVAQTPAPAAQAGAAGNARTGKDLYLRYSCYACHGYAGHGGAGARLVPLRMSLPTFTTYVRSPRQMPPYTAKVLSDAQVADVWAYIQTLPQSPPAKDIPLLNQILSEKP
jgi:mono/diheme cytochrome c family protein